MASRGSSGSGLLITLVIVAVLALGFFVTTVIFYGQASKAQKDLEVAQQASRDFLGGQTDLPWATRWQQAAQSAREPVIAFMNSSWENAMRRTVGDAQTMPDQFDATVSSVDGADTAALTQVINQKNARIQSLQQQVTDANAAASAAAADLQAEVERVAQLQTDHAATVSTLTSEIGNYKDELDRFRTLVDGTIDENNERVATIRRDAADREASLQARVGQLEEESLRLQGQLTALRESQVDATLLPTNEYALVDGRVIGADPAQNAVFIDLGQMDRVVLGMSFEVYSTAASIRPDQDGNYPPGKATVEVIRVNEGSSVARIVRESRGNPIVDGDVIANAVYDPSKVYHFVVFGNFDTDGDRVARPEEQNAIKGIISQWGGIIDDDLTGRTDFVVLGERPILPPQPPIDAPPAIIQQFINQSRIADEYDRLFDAAVKASIPILNQNRLYTRTGIDVTR